MDIFSRFKNDCINHKTKYEYPSTATPGLFGVVDMDSIGKILFSLAKGLGQTLKTLCIGAQHRYRASFLCPTLLFLAIGNVFSAMHQWQTGSTN